MSLTLTELKERISSHCDEIYILELLEINAEDLVERFSDEIEARFEYLCEEFQDDSEQTT